LNAIHDRAPQESAERILLVMLPGVKDRPQDFVQHGFISAIRKHGWPIDIVAVDANMDYYIDGTIVDRLVTDIIGPARGRYRQIWLMGISLGGLGCLNYVRAHAGHVHGVVVLAPYLGARGTIAGIARAGGLACWEPAGLEPDDEDQLLLAWIKSYRGHEPGIPPIFLGYGTADRFIAASTLLAAVLPPLNVVSVAGGHDWAAWTKLWGLLLERDVFGLAAHDRAGPDALR
jgi:pimeloyl-ACP methyl ester carboxylesterase